MVGSLTIALAAPGVMLAADSVAFNKADRNGDFMVTGAELTAWPELQAQFRKLDRDNNGYLDRVEFDHGLAGIRLRQAMEAG